MSKPRSAGKVVNLRPRRYVGVIWRKNELTAYLESSTKTKLAPDEV
jgi:hypothetical protein